MMGSFLFLRRATLMMAAWGLVSISLAQASTPPTDPAARCEVILGYEGICGNQRPQHCPYPSNSAQQSALNAYYELCVYTTPNKHRHSHECIAHYGLGSTCVSTVEPLVEYVAHTQVVGHYALQPQENPQHAVVSNVYYAEYTACYLLAGGDRDKFDAYVAACGEVPPSACAAPSTIKNDYMSVCDDTKPCACKIEKGCGGTCPPEEATEPLAMDPLNPLPPPGGLGAGDGAEPGTGDGGSQSPGTMPPDATIAFGSGESKSPASLDEIGFGGAAVGGKGCAFASGDAGRSRTPFTALLFGLGLGIGLWRLRRRSE